MSDERRDERSAGGPRAEADESAHGAGSDADAGSRSDWRDDMVRAQAGDAEAYQRLLESLLPKLRAYVGRRVQDATAVEDVVQNVLLSIHRARHTYRAERAFEPWLFAITRNAVIDHYRTSGARRARELPLESGPEPSYEPEPGEDPSGLSPELRRALAQIPERQREAVELIQLRGLSVVEAAELAGTTPGALKVRAHRGYRALERQLARDRGES